VRILHISDVHIRNLKYHDEYRRVFQNLYRAIDSLKPDIVVNTGDTAHTKTQISPEFVEMASEHIRQISSRVPYHIILGNHDLNLMNPDRQDAITPIVESIDSPNVFLHKRSGRYNFAPGYSFWIFSLADQQNYPLPSQWKDCPDVNIGLFHGSVSTCVTDSNWRMTHVEHDLSIFDGLDYALLGDIHKQQSFNDKKIWYAGSLIQQNFGEEIDKGFLLWNIEGKDKFDVTSHNLLGSRKFHTISLNPDLTIPDGKYDEDSRLRIKPPRSLTLSEHKTILKNIRKTYKPYDIVMLGTSNIAMQRAKVAKQSIDFENLRQVAVQEKLIRDFLKAKNPDLSEVIVQKILELNRRYQIHVDQKDDTARNVNWEINKIGWSNLFNYGEGNIIDFSHLGGLTGLFAPNASGKSNLIDIITETCFDNTTKGVSKNIFLINDNKESAKSIVDVTANGQDYIIERSIERIKYGQKKFSEAKEWGKTSVSFSMVDPEGIVEPLVGISRPETERNIRQHLGSFEDFMLTSLSAQWNALDIIACKETRRKEILYRFLDLDVFEQKAFLAKEESREHLNRLADLEDNGLEDSAKNYQANINEIRKQIEKDQSRIAEGETIVKDIDREILDLSSLKIKIDKFSLYDWAGEIAKANLKIDSEKRKIDDLLFRQKEIDVQLEKLSKLSERFDLELYEEKAKLLGEVSKSLIEKRAQLKDTQRDLGTHSKNSALLKEVPCGDQFPTCRFLVNAFDSRSRISGLEQKISSLENDVISLVEQQSNLDVFNKKLIAFKEFMSERGNLATRKQNITLQVENSKLKIENLESEREKILQDRSRYEQMEKDIKRNDEVDQKISEKQNQKINVQRNIENLRHTALRLSQEVGSGQGVLDKINSELTALQELRETCSAFEYYTEAMGKDGLPYQIMTEKLPLVNEEINKILSNAADFNVYIEHDADEQSLPIYIQYSEYRSRLLELGSGAEKMLASVAIRAALMSISSLPKPNLFIIDEGFGKLDPKNLESIQRMFDYLKSVFDHVLIISHIDTMKDMVDNIVEITTDEEGYAHVSIGE
jgi:DNA repair exonuclease SbcCD ATPase subunit/DNA repair exonuclease SbcCD nuclease subunit